MAHVLRLAGFSVCLALLAASCSVASVQTHTGVAAANPTVVMPSGSKAGNPERGLVLQFNSKSICNFEAYAQTYSPGPFTCLKPDGSAAAPKLLNWDKGDTISIEGTYDGAGGISVSALQTVDAAPILPGK